MSAGKTHARASVILAGGFLLGGILFRDPACLEYATGALVGTMVGPDNDVDAKNISYKLARKVKLEVLWTVVWHFYRKSIKHGSELSHFPIVSTIGRLAYLFFFAIVIPNLALSLLGYNFWSETNWWAMAFFARWRVWLGLMGSDFIHWGLDILTTEHVGKTHKHGLAAKLRRALR